jgi:hypothetical protein
MTGTTLGSRPDGGAPMKGVELAIFQDLNMWENADVNVSGVYVEYDSTGLPHCLVR